MNSKDKLRAELYKGATVAARAGDGQRASHFTTAIRAMERPRTGLIYLAIGAGLVMLVAALLWWML